MSRMAVASPKRTSSGSLARGSTPSTSAMTAATSSVSTIGFANCARMPEDALLPFGVAAARSARRAASRARRPRRRVSPCAGSVPEALEEARRCASAWTARSARAWREPRAPRRSRRRSRGPRAAPAQRLTGLPSRFSCCLLLGLELLERRRELVLLGLRATRAVAGGSPASTRACTGAAGASGSSGGRIPILRLSATRSSSAPCVFSSCWNCEASASPVYSSADLACGLGLGLDLVDLLRHPVERLERALRR